MANGVTGDRLWTVAEVADHMRVSNMTVYRLIKAGDLPAIRVGKNYRIRGTDLDAYLDAASTTHGVDEAGSGT
jgi:excisionase family DNA binding protein